MRRPPGAAAAAAVTLAVVAAGCGASATTATAPAGREAAAVLPAAAAPAQHGPPYAVGERVLTFVDPRRTIKFPKHPRQPRTLVTVVRYPAPGPPSQVDVRDAPPDRADGPFPLVVFGHGFDVTPATYFRLLRAWAAAGYVVAAPVFPRENAHAPGGADEDDLVNQPRDMSVVISGLLAATGNPRAPLAGTIDPGAIAVSGQSDGGETALATAYDRRLADPRVRAAIILSGAQIPRWRYRYRPGGPPLLAAQGTADKINLPHYTYSFFRAARRPKFLLSLIHAGHLPPYTAEQPQLGIVERVSVDFLDRYLKGDSLGVAALSRDGRRAGIAALTADP